MKTASLKIANYVIAAVIIIAAVLVSSTLWQNLDTIWIGSLRTALWPTVPSTIVSCNEEKIPNPHPGAQEGISIFHPQYKYVVDKHEYIGTNSRWHFNYSYKPYKTGENVTVHYDSIHPENSFLEMSPPYEAIMGTLAISSFLLILVIIFIGSMVKDTFKKSF